MLTEEAHHMFIGEDGVRRIIQRTCQAMQQAGRDDPTDIGCVRYLGVIDLPTLQKKVNQHFAMALDLFGNEISRNPSAFDAGLKAATMRKRSTMIIGCRTQPIRYCIAAIVK
jgi:benzoyl-CoA 2,3-dioxygenase component B